ncbi:MAG: S8 family serine peptidase, partial [Candidatus Aminicenantales bacterium]
FRLDPKLFHLKIPETIGYIDDVHGYDFVRGDGEPDDERGHGTKTAGIVGAVGNNEKGVAGVNWNVKCS